MTGNSACRIQNDNRPNAGQVAIPRAMGTGFCNFSPDGPRSRSPGVPLGWTARVRGNFGLGSGGGGSVLVSPLMGHLFPWQVMFDFMPPPGVPSHIYMNVYLFPYPAGATLPMAVVYLVLGGLGRLLFRGSCRRARVFGAGFWGDAPVLPVVDPESAVSVPVGAGRALRGTGMGFRGDDGVGMGRSRRGGSGVGGVLRGTGLAGAAGGIGVS